MHICFDNYEYNDITFDILDNREFRKLDGYLHHCTNRLEHSLRVSFYSYKICKRLGFDYVSAARGGLLHDFFLNNYKVSSKKRLLCDHPEIALYNACKHFELNDIEIDIIRSHMFPINIKVIPKYRESFVITFVDKIACIYERFTGYSSMVFFALLKCMLYVVMFLSN